MTGVQTCALPIKFIENELVRLESKQFEQEYGKPVEPVREFNRVFRATLEEVWS